MQLCFDVNGKAFTSSIFGLRLLYLLHLSSAVIDTTAMST
ncbi:hypothetical protein HMPREF3214_00640 [Alloscardovia omnicolens]|nr:hypothetical protein HMPREF3214_00640 [Alloscardovia omnicolens]